MQTSHIINEIKNNFASTYKSATPFVNSGDLWDFCLGCIKDPVRLSCIVFANDMGTPPVKSLVTMYRREFSPEVGFAFPGKERQWMGALMGFVFKDVLGYTGQKDRCAVDELGVKSAARFYDGPVHKFEADSDE